MNLTSFDDIFLRNICISDEDMIDTGNVYFFQSKDTFTFFTFFYIRHSEHKL